MKKASFNEFVEDGLKEEVIDMNNPRCNNCNDCCSMGTPINTEEYNKLKKFFKTKKGHTIYSEATHRIKKHTTKDTIYWLCPLSTSTRKCSIYNIRPNICKDFHCSKDLIKNNYDKTTYKDENNYLIWDLFNKRRVK